MRIVIHLQSLLLLPALFITCSIAIADSSSSKNDSTIILGVHPYLPAHEIKQRFTPLADYLGTQLHKKIELKISQNYETHIEHVANNTVDIAFMGPSSYVTLTTTHGNYPLLARLEVKGKPHLFGVIFTRKGSELTDIKQLTGKRFAFGSPHSTMSYIVPRHMLNHDGISLDNLAEYKFLGNHRNVVLGVLLGEFDAGAAKEDVFLNFKDQGLVSIARSPAISEHLFVAGKGMPDRDLTLIRDLMLGLSKTKEGLQILQSIKSDITGLVPVKHSDYDSLANFMTKEGALH